MDAILNWIGHTAQGQGMLAYAAGALLLATALRPRAFPAAVFLITLGACLAAFRWPTIISNSPINPDEAQALAGAITLRSHPIFWQYVDAITSGPLNIYPLTVLGWLGLPLDFTTARLYSLFVIWAALAGVHGLLREEFDELLSRAAVLPAAALYAFTTFWDFVPLSSEQTSIALISVGAALLWRGAKHGRAGATFAGMALLGAVPWAKLQGAPLALWYAAFGGLFLAMRWWKTPRAGRLIGAALAGGVFVTAGFLMVILLSGQWGQWKVAYIQHAFMYIGASGNTPIDIVMRFFAFGAEAPGFNAFFVPLVLVGGLLLTETVFRRCGRGALLGYVGGGVFAALYSVAGPARFFPHYLQFIVMPATLAAGVFVGCFRESLAEREGASREWLPRVALLGFLGFTLLPQFHAHRLQPNVYVPPAPGCRERVRSAAGKLILAHAVPGDTLAMWGWAPHLYVETGLEQAVREGNTERQISWSPLLDFYQQRYLDDLRRRRPRFFVDAVAPGAFAFSVPESFAHEVIMPELGAFIATHYRLMADLDGCRVYELNDDPPRWDVIKSVPSLDRE